MRLNGAGTLQYVRIPVVAQLGAGKSVEYLPIVKFRDVRLPSWARVGDRFVIIEVCGDSLKKHRIFNGDFALVHLTKDIKQGDLVGVLTPIGMLVKYVYLELDGHVRLESSDKKNYPPMWFELSEVEIQGKVVRIERDL
jgi:SOS-response transcriptional repressor LexA